MAAINTGLNNFLSSLSGSSSSITWSPCWWYDGSGYGWTSQQSSLCLWYRYSLAATVTSGGSVVMAAVMAAGMVPPLAVFVATLLFKDKFTEERSHQLWFDKHRYGTHSSLKVQSHWCSRPSTRYPKLYRKFSSYRCSCRYGRDQLLAPQSIFVIALTSNAFSTFSSCDWVLWYRVSDSSAKPLDK